MENSWETKLKEIIIKNVRKRVKADDIHDETDIINDLGCDSSLIIQLVLDIENKLGFEFDDDQLGLEDITIYGELKTYVMKKLIDMSGNAGIR